MARVTARTKRANLAALLGEFALDEIREVPDRLHRLKFRGLELDAEARLHGYDQVDVVKRIPLGYVGGSKTWAQGDAVVIEQIAEYGREL